MRFASLLVPCVCVLAPFALSCESETGDRPVDRGAPPPSGYGERIRDLRDPSNPGQAEQVGQSHNVTGAIVLAVDSFDETAGASRGALGTVYVQDISAGPYAGLTLFAPTFNPANLRVGPGDVVDLRGRYDELKQIPGDRPVIFAPGAVIPQLVQPLATFRYETRMPEPVDIDLNDLADYAKGRQWIGMLVRVKNVVLQEDASRDNEVTGRLAVDLLPPPPNAETKCDAPFPKVPELSNELFDVAPLGLTKGTRVSSIVGLVSFFCTLKIVPRSPADIVR